MSNTGLYFDCFVGLPTTGRDRLNLGYNPLPELTNNVILSSLNAQGDPQYVVDMLTQIANQAGGPDNISVIALKCSA